MPLEITQRETNGIYVLTLSGRLVLGVESSGLRTTIDNLLSSGATRIVISLEHVNYVDSAGGGDVRGDVLDFAGGDGGRREVDFYAHVAEHGDWIRGGRSADAGVFEVHEVLAPGQDDVHGELARGRARAGRGEHNPRDVFHDEVGWREFNNQAGQVME